MHIYLYLYIMVFGIEALFQVVARMFHHFGTGAVFILFSNIGRPQA